MTVKTIPVADAPFSPAEDTLLTGEELHAMGDIGRSELIKGRLISMSPTGHPHGYIEFIIGRILGNFVHQHKLGRILGGEVGIYIERYPDTVRGADVAFISNERMAQVKSRSYLDVAPELIVEVMSPDDRWSEIMEKLAEYFAIGVKVVWVADPKLRQIFAYRSLTNVEHFTANEELIADDVLPDFKVSVADLFGE
ncbi:MAG TPA: Uma2 family endonuclease [Chloroflexi bacterium]|nr:MAG: hypothetical protein B6243_11300 [Anaerolineaceae bacterium 4572_5.2]HEY83781.1 Uma2 family endonuclease [Chloroflexota bacterium]